MSTAFNEVASNLISEKRLDEAILFLQEIIGKMPEGWRPKRDDGQALTIAFWSMDEFLAYGQPRKTAKTFVWVQGSYSYAWYQLAHIAVEQSRLPDALANIASGLKLEPDHPDLWCERGYVHARLEEYQDALLSFEKAATVRDWATAKQLSRALRGQGSALIDLGRLNEAEGAFRRSLEVEPDNDAAKRELEFIDRARNNRAEIPEALPWFLQSFMDPPKDPLTIELLQQIEGMSSIPGPKTVGSENYNQIAEGFCERGWTGFEEVPTVLFLGLGRTI